ncbi:hypothetical protein D5086_000005 [Populus alba]|uniref:Uncharacterized protein n=1 Tax=Populus alba TaxID=43335 RepID=A0ACC4CW70_POPAL
MLKPKAHKPQPAAAQNSWADRLPTALDKGKAKVDSGVATVQHAAHLTDPSTSTQVATKSLQVQAITYTKPFTPLPQPITEPVGSKDMVECGSNQDSDILTKENLEMAAAPPRATETGSPPGFVEEQIVQHPLLSKSSGSSYKHSQPPLSTSLRQGPVLEFIPEEPSADKQVNSDASPSHQVKGNASPATNTDDKQLNVDASTSHQDKGNAITSLATNTDEMSSEKSDSSGETDTDSSGETDTDESASDSSDESQLKPSDLGDVNPITPPLSTNNHVRTSPLELPMCITSKQMALPSSSETSSSSQVPPINLPKMTPSRANPPESISIAQSVGCDDTGFTLVTRRKRRRISPR